jgi:hypothetical protein
MVFEYVSTSADALASANTALGSILMASEYDSNRSLWATKQEMESSEFSCSGRPSVSLIHPIECDPAQSPFMVHYVSDGNNSGTDDKRMEDWCYTNITVINTQMASVVGELWVTYDVELLKPVLPIGGPELGLSTLYKATTGITNAVPFGTSPTIYGQPITITDTGTVLNFSPTLSDGAFIVTMIWFGTAAGVVQGTQTLANAISLGTDNSIFSSVATSVPADSVSSSRYVIIIPLQITGPLATITLAGMTLPSSAQEIQVVISPIGGYIQ